MRDPASADLETELQSQIRELRSKRDYIMKYPESIIGSGGFDTSNPKRKREAKLAKIAAASTCSSPRSSSLTSAQFSAPSYGAGSSTMGVSSPRSMSEGLTSPIPDSPGSSSATSPKRVSMRPGADRRYHTMRQLVLLRENRTGSAPSNGSLLPLSHSADSVKRSATAVAGTNNLSGFASPLRLSGGTHGLAASHPSSSDNSHAAHTSANDVNAMDIDIDELMASDYLGEDSIDSDDEIGSSPLASPTRMVTRSSSSPFSQRTKRAHTAPSKMTTDHPLDAGFTSVKVVSSTKKRSPRRGTSPAAPIDRRITVFNSSLTMPEQSPSKGRESSPANGASNLIPPPRSVLHFSEVPASLSSIAPPAAAASRFAYSGTSQHPYRTPTSEEYAMYHYRASVENWSAPESHYPAPPMHPQPQTSHLRTTLSQSDRNVSYFGEATRRSPSDSSVSDISYSASTTANPTPRSYTEDVHHVYVKYDEAEPAAPREGFAALPYQPETGCLAINLHSNSFNSNYPRNSRCGQCANCLQASMTPNPAGWNGHFEPQPRLSLGSFDASSAFGSQHSHQRTPSFSQAEEHSMAAWSEGFHGATESSYPQANGTYTEQDTYQSYSYGSASFGQQYSSGHQQYAPANGTFTAPLVSSRASSISSASGDLAPSFAAGLELNRDMPAPSAVNASVHGIPVYSASMASNPASMPTHAAAVRSPPQQRLSSSQSSNSPVPTLNVPLNSAGATNASFMSWKKGDQSSAVLIPNSLAGYQQFYGAPMNADVRYGQAEARRMSSSGMDVGVGDFVHGQGLPPVVTSPAPHTPHHAVSYSPSPIPSNVYNHHMDHSTSAWP